MQTLGSTSVPALLKYLRHAERLGLDIAPCPGRRRPPGRPAQRQSPAPAGRSPRAPAQLSASIPAIPVRPAFGALRPARLLGVLGYIAMNCATLGEAMSRITPYEAGRRHGHQPHRGGRQAGPADLELPPPDTPGTAPHGRARPGFLGPLRALDRRPEGSPDEVWLEHDLPDGTRVEDYETFFGCPVRFTQPCSALLVPLDYLALPLRQADALLRTLEEHALALMAELDDDEPLPLRVKNALRQLLKDGLPRGTGGGEVRHDRTHPATPPQAGSSTSRPSTNCAANWPSTTCCIASCRSGHRPVPGLHRVPLVPSQFQGWTGQTPGEYRQRRKEPAARERRPSGHRRLSRAVRSAE